jgi:predicted SprT family Zn-dependent metalloprotease
MIAHAPHFHKQKSIESWKIFESKNSFDWLHMKHKLHFNLRLLAESWKFFRENQTKILPNLCKRKSQTQSVIETEFKHKVLLNLIWQSYKSYWGKSFRQKNLSEFVSVIEVLLAEKLRFVVSQTQGFVFFRCMANRSFYDTFKARLKGVVLLVESSERKLYTILNGGWKRLEGEGKVKAHIRFGEGDWVLVWREASPWLSDESWRRFPVYFHASSPIFSINLKIKNPPSQWDHRIDVIELIFWFIFCLQFLEASSYRAKRT